MRRRLDLPLLLLIVAAGAAFSGAFAVRATEWVVMSDELQTLKLALGIAGSGSPVPSIHSEYYGSLSQLYPLLMAPLVGLLPMPAAFTAVHGLNSVLMASAALPAYGLTRSVTRMRSAALLVAALTVVVPWIALTTTLLTDVAAYPAFVWAVYLAQRTLARASPSADALALLGLVVAFFARTQFFLLALVVPLALAGHEAAFAHARGEAVVPTLRRAVSRHRLLLGGYAAGALALLALSAVRPLGTLLGNYSATLEGSLLPAGIWRATAQHLDIVAVGVGVLPLVLAAGWTAAELARPGAKEAHAFAVLLVLLAPLLTLQVSSFDLRFTPGGFVQDRYLFYLTPLLFTGLAAWLADPGRLRLRAAGALAAAAAFAWLAGFASYTGATVIYWASPAGAFHPALARAARAIGLEPLTLVRFGGLLACVLAVAGAAYAGRRRTAIGVGAALLGFCLLETGYVLREAALPAAQRQTSFPGERRDWIDAATPTGRSVLLVPNAYLPPNPWWDAEFWNKRADRVLALDGATTYTPFPAEAATVDFRTGALAVRRPTPLLAIASNETRFRLRGEFFLAGVAGIALVRVDVPYRADWATRGTMGDGWSLPGTPILLRLFPTGREREGRELTITLSAAESGRRHRYRIFVQGRMRRSGSVPPGGFRSARIRVCVPARQALDVRLDVRGTAELPDDRRVGLHLDAVTSAPTGAC